MIHRRLLIALALGAGTTFLASCATVSELVNAARPTASVRGVRLSDLDLTHVTLAFDVDVTNSMGLALPVLDSTYELETNGESFLSGSIHPGGSVPAHSTKTIAVPVRVEFAPALELVRSLSAGQVVPYTASLGLSVDAPGVGPITLPLSHDGEFPVPSVPSLSLPAVDFQEVSLSGVKAVVSVEVENTNQFGVDLENLFYSLALDGVPLAGGNSVQTQSFAPGQTATLAIPFELSARETVTAVVNVLTQGQTEYLFEGTLSLQTPFGHMSLPFSTTGTTLARS